MQATMTPEFITPLECEACSDTVWRLTKPLVYYSALAGVVFVPTGFETDFASVPRLPIVYALYGNRAHHEGVIHDYLFRKGCEPLVSFDVANKVFLEAMEVRGKSALVRYPMYWAVCLFSRPFFQQRGVLDRL